jgi:SAM-dependent methyltransferase
MPTARYDGQTAWYDAFAAADVFASARQQAVRFLGPGPGGCLDLGCGTGRAIPLLAEAGWKVTGTDVSADQLAAAATHAGRLADELVRADAHDLPFANETFDAVASILTHTDFDDVGAVFREVHRILRTGGTFAYVGVHPCFASPSVEPREDGPALLHPGYREAGWQHVSRDPEKPGIRARVGINHLPLAALLNAALESGLALTELAEPGDTDPPLFLGFRAVKS